MRKARSKRKNMQLSGSDHRYTVRGIRREPVDISKLSKALLGLVRAEIELQAKVDHAQRSAHNRDADAATDPVPQSGDAGDG